jgi:hypothetical protein
MRTLPALLAAAAAALAAGPSRAAEGRLAVVSLDAPPELTFMGKSAAEAFAKEAAKGGAAVLSPSKVEERLGRAATIEIVRCGDDPRCLAARAAPLDVDRVVGGSVRKHGETYRVSLVHADARTGARLGALEREVPIASRRLNKELALAAPLLLAGQADAKGVLSIVTTPAGALVTVDDVPVGTTPLSREVKPGRHKVQVAATGYFDAAPVWVDVPANAIVEHKPRLYEIPARDRPNSSATEGSGTRVRISR